MECCFDIMDFSQVDKLGTKSELPYRMALHPGGDGVIFAMQNSCRYFDFHYSCLLKLFPFLVYRLVA